MRMRSPPCRVIVGSATPNWSTRLRIVSTPCRTASSRSCEICRSRMARTKRPAFSSRSLTSKLWNSAATVRASFQLLGLASSTTTRPRPSGATFFSPTPLRSSAFLKSSAARSLWLAMNLSVSTPSTRWMPPCRSSPRLMRFDGGYRYQMEMITTAATSPRRSQRRLGILVARDLHHASDGPAIELELHLVGHAQLDGVFAQPDDRPVHPAGRHHAVALLQRAEHALAVGLLLLLRAQHDEVEDREHRRERQQHLHEASGPTVARRRGGRVGDVEGLGEDHRGSGLQALALIGRNKVG